ncbi:MAG: chorismate synthase [Clostridiales bacterium]|nr:chorismate synthase [Clostridiales bacterium]
MPGNVIGEKLKVTVFGQSHAPGIGAVVEGYPAGRRIDWDQVAAFMGRRAPGKNAWSTTRKEGDQPEVLSGLNDQGLTCGSPICAVIRNENQRSKDYSSLKNTPRPGHADFAAYLKWGEDWDVRGGGPFSGRMTAPICFAGALCLQYLKEIGIEISAHIARIGSIADESPDLLNPPMPLYEDTDFPVISGKQGEAMKAEIESARQAGDSIGGAVRCVVTGLPGGLGGPLFAGLEGKLAMGLFGIPAVKGVEFGAGFRAASARGSENNDAFCLENGKIRTASNCHGGILGGISTGMPLYFTVAFKPTPSIAMPQQTVNLETLEETELIINGRHDPCVVPRAVPVVEAVTAIILMDEILQGA